MPAQSKSQQRLMGVAYAVKSGDMQLSDVDVAYRDKIESLVDGMTKKDLKKYAETKHDDLPEVVETVQGTAIAPNQIGGMGPVLLPADGNVGSGDVPTGPQVADIDDDEEEKKQKGTKKKLEMENLYTSFNEFLNEATNINDPVLMAMRAKRMEIEKAKALPKKRKLTPKQEQNILDSIWDIDTELKELRQERSQIFADMEAEAGQMDYAEFEEQGLHNHYGDLLNGVDEKIAKLKAKKQQLELKLV